MNSTALSHTIRAIFDRWGLTDVEASRVLGVSDEGWIVDATRVTLIIDIYEGVFSLLQNATVEKVWIREPRADFDGRSIFDLLTEGSMPNLMIAHAYVDHVNGR